VREGATPLLVVAGALGAGKTTLLARCLGDPAFARTAVVIDELAELVVDTHLLPASTAPVKRAPCGRWTDALRELAADGADFQRVIVETNGVATPARIAEELSRDEELARRFPLAGIVAAVDATGGENGLSDAHARAHAIGADALVLTKLDMAEADGIPAFVSAVMRLNPYAEILRASSPQFALSSLWSVAAHAPGRELRQLQGLVHEATVPQVGSLCVRFAHAVELSGFCVRLGAFLEQHAAQLLRVKGLVRVEGRHGPAVIQAVGGLLYPVRTLKEWPVGVEESALVVVARGIPDDELRVAVESTGAARRKPMKAKR
jgi:G3E family GTPase